MRVLLKKYEQYLDDSHTGEILFFTGFIIQLVRSLWITTMFPYSGLIGKLCLILSLMLIGSKILLYDIYTLKEFFICGGLMICVLAVYLNSRYLDPFLWFLIIVGCKDISFEKILKVYLIITGAIVFLAFCAALLGVIENLRYETGRGIRIAFGSVYVTDFAAHIFYMILVYCYLEGERLKAYHYIGIAVIAGVVYYFCKTRLDSICILLIAIIFGLNHWLMRPGIKRKRLQRIWKKSWKWGGIFVIPVLAFFSIIATAFYSENSRFLNIINHVISGRLSLGKTGLEKYGISLFGQTVDMIGAGGTTEFPSDYFFIDCSYVHVLLRYGAIFTVILLAIYMFCSYKNKHDIYFLFAIFMVAVNSVIAHHILDLAYNPFACVLLAVCVRKRKSERINGFTTFYHQL